MLRRRTGGYFERIEGAPAPISILVKRRVALSEVDVMGIAWHGRYPVFFEEAWQAMARQCGLSYQDFFEANVQAPIVQIHIDYHRPLRLEEEFTVRTLIPWCEGAKFLTEYEIRAHDGTLITTGYTVQLFIDGRTGEPLIASPDLLERMRARWKAGEFSCLE
ncbi:MAG TPA: acyl-CoA thioesterase [Candidatus Hydrogenedentes bacterium]|nr:acyl-CoA thioesterase [Candidatus Hydrogenedentota bacterium]